MAKSGRSNRNSNLTRTRRERLTPTFRIARDPTGTDFRDPKNGRYYAINSYWVNSSTGDLWYLADIVANVADWRKLSDAQGSVSSLRDQVDTEVLPHDPNGYIDIDGSTVANAANPSAIPVETVGGTNVLTVQVQVGAAVASAPGDKNDAGLLSANSNHFAVDADGWLELDVAGTSASAPADTTGLGGVTPSSNHFSVDANGWLQLDIAAVSDSTPADTDNIGGVQPYSGHFDLDANGWLELDESVVFGTVGYRNIGFSYSAGTFTINGSDGSALSASNPAIITLPDKDNANQTVVYRVTSNQAFIDDAGSSEILNNLFGTTTTVAWANDMPFFVYAVSNDAQDTVQFMLSRNPCAFKSPAAANIGAPDDAVADAQRDFWSFDNIDETLYEGNPCLPIGGIRMQKSASDDWTVQALDASKDGPGKFYEGVAFSFPQEHFGAATGTWFLDRSDATYPVFDTESYTYYLSKDGWVDINVVLISCNTTGSGTNPIVFTVPLQSTTETGETSMGQTSPIRGNFIDDSASSSNLYTGYLGAGTNTTSTTSVFLKEGTATSLQPVTFTGVTTFDTFNFGHRYKAF